MVRLYVLLPLICLSQWVHAQQISQTIRGSVIDQASNTPISDVNISVLGTQLGTISDLNGNFKLEEVPIGRYDIEFSLLGHQSVIVRELQVGSAKEVVLTIAMQESVTALDEIVIRPKTNKEGPLNPMAAVSAKMLSVEEAQRFAGGFDDPARLVSSFAGVSSNVGNNAIIVRGNNPQALQWRLEGIEISNPNHFADLGSFGGGGLTALSAQSMANSDFMSGAMPAQYGNALSGVFDIFMEMGNDQKHQHTFQVGAIGIDLASEGPFKKEGMGSYMFNYRYSTLGLMASILPDNAAGTNYQDLSFKLNFPTKKAGVFSLWGLGLLDHSDASGEREIIEWEYDGDREEQEVDQFMGAVGLSHKVLLNDRQYIKSTLAVTGNGIDMETDVWDSTLVQHPRERIENKSINTVLSSFVSTKFGAKHTNRSGLVATFMGYDLLLQESDSLGTPLRTMVNEKGSTSLLGAYSSSTINPNERITVHLGLRAQWFALNGSLSLEPRFGIAYKTKPSQSFSFGYGLHSRLERLNHYFIRGPSGSKLNEDLSFTKAHHFVLGYDAKISEHAHLKLETYYQWLYNVPIAFNGSFSMINLLDDWFIDERLQNGGSGENYGLDVTYERFLSDGYYYLVTGSIFNSRYQGADGVWRDTRYNRDFALNLLFGKEWMIGQYSNQVLGLNLRLSYQGGDRYSPIDLELSQAAKDVIFDESRAFSKQFPPSLTTHITISYKMNRSKIAHEFALKVINLTQYREHLGFRYNYRTDLVDDYREATFIPNISYKIEF